MGEIADWMIEQMLEFDPKFTPEFFNDKPRRPTFEEWRELFVWTDINKVAHPLKTIDDRYLANIIPYLERRYNTLPHGEDKTKRVGKILLYLHREQRYRANNHIVTPITSVMKVKQSKEV